MIKELQDLATIDSEMERKIKKENLGNFIAELRAKSILAGLEKFFPEQINEVLTLVWRN